MGANPSQTKVVAGPRTALTLDGSQAVLGTVTAVLGSAAATSIGINLCYQSGSGQVTEFRPLQYLAVATDPTHRPYTVSSGTAALPAGTYTWGFCTLGNGSPLATNDYLTGWFQVVPGASVSGSPVSARPGDGGRAAG